MFSGMSWIGTKFCKILRFLSLQLFEASLARSRFRYWKRKLSKRLCRKTILDLSDTVTLIHWKESMLVFLTPPFCGKFNLGLRAYLWPFFKTFHFIYGLERIDRGYLCGTNDQRWNKYLLNFDWRKNKKSVETSLIGLNSKAVKPYIEIF